MFEYQTAICELTGLPVSNASVYEGPSAVAAAGYLAKLANGSRASSSRAGVHPHCARDAARRYAARLRRRGRRGAAARRRHRPRRAGPTAIDDDTGAVFFQQPNFLGAVEDVAALAARRQGLAAPCVVGSYDPIAARHPRAARASRRRRLRRRGPVARQPPGLRRPVVRLLRRHRGATCAACRAASRARPPTSTAAAASCSRCRPASSTSAARRRPSNICTAAGAQRAGRRRLPAAGWAAAGIVELGELLLQRTALRARDAGRARRRRAAARPAGGARVRGDARRAASTRVIDRCAAEGVNPGFALGAPTTSTRRPARGDHRAALARATSTAWPRCSAPRWPPSASGRRARSRQPLHATRHRGHDRAARRARPRRRCSASTRHDLREGRAGPPRVRRARRSTCPSAARRAAARRACAAPSRRACPRSPSRRSCATTCACRKRNFDLDSGFYPLGSCTMKHNPRLHERVAALPGHARLHPLQRPERAAGRARADVEPRARAGRGRRPAARLAAAVGRLARRARRACC